MHCRALPAAVLIAAVHSAVSAATFTVTNTNDSGSGSLRDAFAQAEVAAGPDTIVFDTAGVFSVPRAIVVNTPISFSGIVTLTAPVPVQNRVALRGSAAGTRLLAPRGSSATLTVTDLSFEDGHAVGNSEGGGALKTGPETVLTLNAERCFFTDCQADGFGGVLRVAVGSVNLTDCTITDNAANGASVLHADTGFVTVTGGVLLRNANNGGGVGTADLIFVGRGWLTLDGAEIADTSATYIGPHSLAVGVYTGIPSETSVVPVTLRDCHVHDNIGTFLLSNTDSVVEATRCTFEDNGVVFSGSDLTIRDCSFGGHDRIGDGDVVLVEDSSFESNDAGISGGQVTLRRVDYRSNGGMPFARRSLTIEDSDFRQNAGIVNVGSGYPFDLTIRRSSVVGGTGGPAVYGIGSLLAAGVPAWLQGRNVVLESCTFDGNTGVAAAMDSAKVLNCTFSGNSGQAVLVVGGTDDTTADLTVQNTVFSANVVTNGAGVALQAVDPIRSNGGNFFDASQAMSWASGSQTLHDRIGTPAAPLNALLGPLSNWGGAGRARMPLSGSPLIDGGWAVPAAPDYQEPILDQTGMPRVNGAIVDVGAVEARSQFTVTTTASAGAGSLRSAIASAAGLQNGEVIFDPTVFATPQTITLASPIGITASVKISGPTVGVALNGGNANRLLNITGASTRVEVSRVHFTAGQLTGDGGAVTMNTGANGSLIARDCLFTQNRATARGGALAVLGGTAWVTNCLFNDNSADETGGAVAVAGPGIGHFTNCTLTLNTARRGGGGLVADAGQASLVNCTVTANTADSDAGDDGNGGGVRVVGTGSPLRIGNTVVAGNADASTGAGATVHPDISGAFLTLGHNFIGKSDGQTASGSAIVNGTAGDLAGTAAAPLAPNLGGLAQNGGLFRSQKPNTGSPLINAGDGALLGDIAWPEPPVYDVRVQFRTVGVAPEIGAVEAPDQIYAQLIAATTPTSVAEGQPDAQARYLLRRSRPGTAVSVVIARGAAATAASDDFTMTGPGLWVLQPGAWQAQFAAAELEKTLLLLPTDDVIVEPDETAVVGIVVSADYLIQSVPAASRTTTIVSNDVAVTTTGDSGAGSLRELLTAPLPLTHMTIVFDPAVFSGPRTIALATGILLQQGSSHRTVQGPPFPLTVSGGGTAGLLNLINATDIVFRDVNFADGHGGPAFGGYEAGVTALFLDGYSSLTLQRCCVRDCDSPASGGAVGVAPGSQFQAENCTFARNEAAKHGGAIYIWPTARVTLSQCTLAENHADTDLSGDGEGGAVYVAPKDSQVWFTDGFLSIQGCHVSMNTDQLAHVEVDATSRARHIALPIPSAPAIHNGGGNYFTSPFEQGFIANDDVIASTFGWTPNAGGLILPLAYNGGPTMTYALAVDSPARGACRHFFGLTDQRGIARDLTSDAGAYNLTREPYEFWVGYAFPSGATQTGKLDDPDGDGQANILEQFMGTDPTRSGSRGAIGMSVLVLEAPGNPRSHDVQLTFPLSPRVAQGQFQIFRSFDLDSWEYLDTSDSVRTVNGGLVVTANVSAFDLHRYDPQGFFRLTVVEP